MKHYFLIVILTSITVTTFAQEKSNVKPFANPTETTPRFLEDVKLTESQNKASFNTKIKNRFIKYIKNSAIKDSFDLKILVGFKIDTTGVSSFQYVKSQNSETTYLNKELTTIINSFPKFIPATQRNKKVAVFYIIPLFKNE